MNQSSPRQPPPSTHRPEGPQGPNFPLPTLSQATGQAAAADRERAREVEQIHIKEEQDRQHREQERQRLEQAPQHQAQGQPMHLHQPVAVGPRTVHGPNGLLGNPGLAGPQPQGQFQMGGPAGPNSMFGGGPVQSAQAQNQSNASALLMPFAQGQSQAAQQQQMGAQGQGQAQGQTQGQQPILNDALSYLDQVKVQFADHPDVYNRFLDIMKDFKSGAIDTPGVIGRVSQLFAGNPELIQGFNTFLPPGYRIECGAGDDPNAIRVTTPMGTTVQSMPQPRPLSRQEGGESMRRANGTYTPQPGQGNQMMMSPGGRNVGPAMQGPHISPMDVARQQEQQAMHRQQEHGVNQLQNAVSAATGGATMRAAMSPAPGRGTPLPGQDAMIDGHGMEKRGPVEFNHAISYVNKIKNRFATQPDIYKQFLEILQTYQRESKPIQDVYGQVTHLFKTAPDLLGDFKQFLPESAAAAKAQAQARQQAEEQAMMSNARGEPMYASPVMSKEVGMGTPNHRGLPPVGNFAPTPVVKDNKRKRGERQGTAGSAPDGAPVPVNGKGPYPGPGGKRVKQAHNMAQKNDQPPASPTLIPALPSPIPPTTSSAATSEELSFFDRAKKAISNKNTFNEFLKLCNLFSQDLVDRTVLVHRARSFIGTNPELMKWFQDFIGYDEKDVIVDNKARIPGGRVSLSNCRGLGPSYRLLPKRERQKTCSGRDELCNSVLNDEWASHPTWASEDSGFIAHKKNLHEEGLHRIEEERHDYDYNIEACSRTIQLLEPLAQSLRRLSEQEQLAFKLPPGLGGQSETIYKRVIMKLYGREKGQDVIQQLHLRPYQVIPVLLNRLKERLETWKLAQREWEKVWREQTQRMFWKSLDHQFVNTRTVDKRALQLKVLQAEIQMKHEEMKREDKQVAGVMRKPQLEYTLEDTDVVLDLAHLLLVHIDQAMSTDTPRLIPFIKEFVPLFFGLDVDWFNAQINARVSATDTPVNETADDYASGAEDSTPSRGRKNKSNNLLRSALDRGRGRAGRKDRDDSNASASRASTPDVASVADDEMAVDTAEESESKSDPATSRWLDHPSTGNVIGDKSVDPGQAYTRQIFRMWSNTPIYGFIRLFVMLYERLLKLKLGEDECRETIQKAKTLKPAAELGIVDKQPQDFFDDVSQHADYYRQMLDKFVRCFAGEVDFADIEETLRRFYLQSGYPLYSLDKIITQLSRFAANVLNSEGKDKSYDIYQLFKRDRVKDTTTAMQQTDYRKAVEKALKDGDLYRVDFDQESRQIRFYLTKRDDPTFDDCYSATDKEHMWRYYLASYTSLASTEGIEFSKLHRPVLNRNVRATGIDPNSASFPPSPADGDDSAYERVQRRFDNVRGKEALIMRIAVNNYQRIYQPSTEEGWVEILSEREGGQEGIEEVATTHDSRSDDAKGLFDRNNVAMKGITQDAVEKANEEFHKLIADGTADAEADSMDIA